MNKPIILVLFFFVLSFKAEAQSGGMPKTKPNIIFILTDDLGIGDVGVFYQNLRKLQNNPSKPYELTPNIDAMAKRGAILTQSYCNAPVCAPSRASLILGVNQGQSNVRDNQFDKALEDNYTLGNVLQLAGYKTAVIGKWGLQGDNRWNTNGDQWPAAPLKRGFDYFFGYMRHTDGHEHYPKEGIYRGPKQIWENHKEISKDFDNCYTTDLWTAAAKKWIIEQSKGSEPFFMYLAYDTPHAVLELPTQKYPDGKGLNGGMQWLGSPGKMINTASGKPDSWMQPEYEGATYDEDNNAKTPKVPWPDTYKRYATATGRIDNAVGDLMMLLKDLKIDRNTIVVFTSDNGPSIESYLPSNYVDYSPTFFDSFSVFDGIKRDCWEGGIRMPTIVQWPDHISAGQKVESPSIFSDWMATFLDAAGMPAPVKSDGVSILPALTGKGKQRESLIYVEYYHDGKTPAFKDFEPNRRNIKRGQMQVLRSGNYVGVRYDIKSAEDNFEIYDVINDPKQTMDLSKDPSMGFLQQQMKAKVLQVRRPSTGAPRPYDDALVPSIQKVQTNKGLLWKEYKDNFFWIPQTTTLTELQEGKMDNPSSVDPRFFNNGVVTVSGFIKIPEDGSYTFYLKSDKGAFLRIHEATIIDEDYKYNGEEKSAIINLKAGLHPITLTYKIGMKSTSLLSLMWKKPSGIKTKIPAFAFCH